MSDAGLGYEEEFPDRWARVMCDYSCWGLWNSRGEACGPEDLLISEELKRRFEAWQLWYDGRDLDESHWPDLEAHSAEGLLIARALKAQLPDWTIFYFDEAKCPKSYVWPPILRAIYEYEITADDAEK